MLHQIKVSIKEFAPILNRQKHFEVVYGGTNIKVGHELMIKEYDEVKDVYTGREILVNVTHVMTINGSCIAKDLHILSFCIVITSKEDYSKYRKVSLPLPKEVELTAEQQIMLYENGTIYGRNKKRKK